MDKLELRPQQRFLKTDAKISPRPVCWKIVYRTGKFRWALLHIYKNWAYDTKEECQSVIDNMVEKMPHLYTKHK